MGTEQSGYNKTYSERTHHRSWTTEQNNQATIKHTVKEHIIGHGQLEQNNQGTLKHTVKEHIIGHRQLNRTIRLQ